ncbi:hypothetical protein GJAV_G00027820 [Gymnothorax javanicus]|nr:hypothetical protein GJAV_G00027820 [Gymnothorax javanicus]
MNSPPKLSGETLIVHHIPLVHCQVTGRRCRGQVKRPASFGPPVSLSLTRTTSLPEHDVLHREALLYSSLIQTSSNSTSSTGVGLGSKGGARAGQGCGSLASDDCSSSASNASEEPPPPAQSLPKPRERCNTSRQNPFLRDTEEKVEEKEEGNLNGYLKDSFHLHGNSNANVSLANGAEASPFHLHDEGYTPEPFLLHSSLGGGWDSISSRSGATDSHERAQTGPSGAHSEFQNLGLSDFGAQRRHGSSGSTLSMEWGDEEEEDEDQPMTSGRACSCCSSSDAAPPVSCSSGLSEPFPEDGRHLHQCYGSDSSCNSSDGMLVNFSAIYNKMSNVVPTTAKLANLNDPNEQICTSSSDEPGGAFYLDLQTSPTESCVGLDANCNSYPMPQEGAPDMTSCFQSQVRLVVATQNYYKLVTCDLSSQSSPSPLGSSLTSCPEEPQGPSPAQPTEYFLFRQQEEKEEKQCQSEEEDGAQTEDGELDPTRKVIEGQVYVNASPPVSSQGGAEGRLRSRSYDRHLDHTPSPWLGSLERMLSCPVRLSEGATDSPAQAPPRVTSFAEIARSKRRNGAAAAWFAGASGGSPSLRVGPDTSSSQSLEFSPIPELLQLSHSHSLPPLPFARPDTSPHPHHQEARTKAEGGLSSSSEGGSAVVRYRKDQRPNSLPIQPFSLHQQLGHQQGKLLRPLLTEYVNNMQSRVGQEGARERPSEEQLRRQAPGPGSVRPSPLGSYSPIRQQGELRSRPCSACSPSPRPPRSLSCPLTAGLHPVRPSPGGLGPAPEPTLQQAPHPQTSPPPRRRKDPPTTAKPANRLHSDFVPPAEFSPLDHGDPAQHCSEGGTANQSCCSGPRPADGQSAKQQQNYYSDIFPDYFSLAERPPEEFCLSPDASSESLSIDLLQKKALVKAVNIAVDLIVAHFGTSRDPGVKAKLGNSLVSPNVGHLILKYLCPAIRDILQDGLRGYVLDLIIGQRRNVPWSVVEASTQLGPSTRVLHGLYCKVSQYSELSSHSMRLNAFILGLLNLQSLEFWFNHLYTHEDVIEVHYHPWGFLPLSQGACQPLFEELLLLLQPLSLLPFHLDLLFEPELLHRGQEHLWHKEQLCSIGQNLEQSTHSTFQLMRGWASLGAEPKREGVGLRAGRMEQRQDGLRLRKEGVEPMAEEAGLRKERFGVRPEGPGREAKGVGFMDGWREWKVTEIGAGPRREVAGCLAERVKGVGSESECSQGAGETEVDRNRDSDNGAKPRDKQAGWWYQLMQSSQVYIDNSAEGSKFVKWEKRKKPAGEAAGGGHGAADSGAGRRLSPPPPREGVVEGAEANQEGAGLKEEGGSSSSSSDSSGAARGWRSWMGSPPESVLGELKKSLESLGPEAQGPAPGVQEEGPSLGLRWSRLFGAGIGTPSDRRRQSSHNTPSLKKAGFHQDG